ncbi:MAG: TMEM175 family protein [Flavobacteriaceae bacterium]
MKNIQNKLNNQLKRIINITDSVFAVALTLLVIDIRIPIIENPTDGILWNSLKELKWTVLGFIISFFIVGYYWSVHHRIFGYVKEYTTRLMWLNLIFLLSVVLLPFTSGFLGKFAFNIELVLPYALYVFNICLTAFANSILWFYVSNPKNNLLTYKISKERIYLGFYFTLVVPILFIISLLIVLINPIIGRLIPLAIPFVLRYGLTGLTKKIILKENSN